MKPRVLLVFLFTFAVFGLNSCKPLAEEVQGVGASVRFNSSGTFRIAQFTDIHWDPASENNHKTLEIIRLVLEEEKPDLVIYTGDIVTKGPSLQGWLDVTKPLVDAGIPWAVTLGNHDDEAEVTRVQVFELLVTLTGFVGISGPADLPGTGNYVLPIKSSSSDKTAALIWCFDSHGYPEVKSHGDYDWIKFDQIAWYRSMSRYFSNANNRQALPALAYFHIPLPEYKEVAELEGTVGRFEEKVCSPDINTGLFSAFLEMGDVMGMFVGHDHVNNYIGIHHGIALGYGQVSGADAYGNFPRGSRIVELQEGSRGFKTWIRTADGVMDRFDYPVPVD
jgi:hypothetical protein